MRLLDPSFKIIKRKGLGKQIKTTEKLNKIIRKQILIKKDQKNKLKLEKTFKPELT